MRALLVGLILAATACASPPARADSAVQYSADAVHSCIAAANGSTLALQACKGVGARPCIDAEGGSTLALALCWDEEANTWMEVRDVTLARLRSPDSTHTDMLQTANEAWAHWVDVECAYRGALYEGGSGAEPEMARCAAELVADRAISLMETERAR